MRFVASALCLFSVCTDQDVCRSRLFAGNRICDGKQPNGVEAQSTDSNDLWILPNGNILFTTGHGVLEMTRQNDTIFHYESKSPVFACQRLKNGNTFVGECVTGRMLEISPKGRL